MTPRTNIASHCRNPFWCHYMLLIFKVGSTNLNLNTKTNTHLPLLYLTCIFITITPGLGFTRFIFRFSNLRPKLTCRIVRNYPEVFAHTCILKMFQFASVVEKMRVHQDILQINHKWKKNIGPIVEFVAFCCTSGPKRCTWYHMLYKQSLIIHMVHRP